MDAEPISEAAKRQSKLAQLFKKKRNRLGLRIPKGELFPQTDPKLKVHFIEAATGTSICNTTIYLSEADIEDKLGRLFEVCHEKRGLLHTKSRMWQPFWASVKASERIQWARNLTSLQLRFIVLTLTQAAWKHLQDPRTNKWGEITAPTSLTYLGCLFAHDIQVYEAHMEGREGFGVKPNVIDFLPWTAKAHTDDGKLVANDKGVTRYQTVFPLPTLQLVNGNSLESSRDSLMRSGSEEFERQLRARMIERLGEFRVI